MTRSMTLSTDRLDWTDLPAVHAHVAASAALRLARAAQQRAEAEARWAAYDAANPRAVAAMDKVFGWLIEGGRSDVEFDYHVAQAGSGYYR